MDYASDHSDTLKGLAIVDSAPTIPFKGVLALLTADLVTPKAFASLEEVENFYRGELGKYMAAYTVKQREDGRYVLKFDKKNIAPKSLMEGMRRNRRLWRCMKKIKVPTLILRAEKSKIVSPKTLGLMKLALPQAKTAEIAGVGHEFVFTRGDEVGKVLRDFFKQA